MNHVTLCAYVLRFGRSERSGRYASDRGRDDPEWRERRDREQDRDYDQRWSDERHTDRFDERRERDGPEVRLKESSYGHGDLIDLGHAFIKNMFCTGLFAMKSCCSQM